MKSKYLGLLGLAIMAGFLLTATKYSMSKVRGPSYYFSPEKLAEAEEKCGPHGGLVSIGVDVTEKEPAYHVVCKDSPKVIWM